MIEVTCPDHARDHVRRLALYPDSEVKEYRIPDPDKRDVPVYLLSEGYSPPYYSFDDAVAVGICDGELKIGSS